MNLFNLIGRYFWALCMCTIIVPVVAFVLIRAQSGPEGMTRALSIFGFKMRFRRSESAFGLIVGALVVLALFVAINPEARVFLVFLDSFGVDLFVALCALFVRHNLELCVAIILIPILKGIYRWGPVPGFWPSRVVLRSSVSWTVYAIFYPTVAALMAVLLVRWMVLGVWT